MTKDFRSDVSKSENATLVMFLGNTRFSISFRLDQLITVKRDSRWTEKTLIREAETNNSHNFFSILVPITLVDLYAMLQEKDGTDFSFSGTQPPSVFLIDSEGLNNIHNISRILKQATSVNPKFVDSALLF
jgi:hypothetical protein